MQRCAWWVQRQCGGCPVSGVEVSEGDRGRRGEVCRVDPFRVSQATVRPVDGLRHVPVHVGGGRVRCRVRPGEGGATHHRDRQERARHQGREPRVIPVPAPHQDTCEHRGNVRPQHRGRGDAPAEGRESEAAAEPRGDRDQQQERERCPESADIARSCLGMPHRRCYDDDGSSAGPRRRVQRRVLPVAGEALSVARCTRR